MAKWRSQSLSFESMTDKQITNKQNTTWNFFGPDGVQNSSPPNDMMIEEVLTILALQKHIRIQRIVSPLRALKIWGKMHHLNLNPITPKPLERIRPNFNTWLSMKLPTKGDNLVNSFNGYTPVGRLYFEHWVKVFIFGAHTPTHALVWVKFGTEESTDYSTPNLTPIGERFALNHHLSNWDRCMRFSLLLVFF